MLSVVVLSLLAFTGNGNPQRPTTFTEVCHFAGGATVGEAVSVPSMSLSGHYAHGDYQIVEEVCGNAVDDDCDGEVDEDCCPCYDAESLRVLVPDYFDASNSSCYRYEGGVLQDHGLAFYTRVVELPDGLQAATQASMHSWTEEGERIRECHTVDQLIRRWVDEDGRPQYEDLVREIRYINGLTEGEAQTCWNHLEGLLAEMALTCEDVPAQ